MSASRRCGGSGGLGERDLVWLSVGVGRVALTGILEVVLRIRVVLIGFCGRDRAVWRGRRRH